MCSFQDAKNPLFKSAVSNEREKWRTQSGQPEPTGSSGDTSYRAQRVESEPREMRTGSSGGAGMSREERIEAELGRIRAEKQARSSSPPTPSLEHCC